MTAAYVVGIRESRGRGAGSSAQLLLALDNSSSSVLRLLLGRLPAGSSVAEEEAFSFDLDFFRLVRIVMSAESDCRDGRPARLVASESGAADESERSQELSTRLAL